MKCWICGGDGTTGEHLIKASDLKSHFKVISQEKPVYHNTFEKKNTLVKSVKSDKLKSDALICPNCNNNLSQPYDRSWETLSNYLRANWSKSVNAGVIPLNEVFKNNIEESMLNVHLLFVKIFGCRIIENEVPININRFSQAFLKKEAHKNIYLSFEQRLGEENIKIAGMTPIYSANINNTSIFATWYYIIDRLAVNVIYDSRKAHKKLLRKCWTPNNHGNKLHIYNNKI